MAGVRVEKVTQIGDARLSPYADLRHPMTRPASELFIAEGRFVLDSLLRSGLEIESLLVEAGRELEFVERLESDVPIYSMEPAEISRLVGFDFHRGVLACGRRPQRRPLECVDFSKADSAIVLSAIGVGEATNLGSMLRTAAGFGVKQILLGPGSHDPFARRVIRTSMASVFFLDFFDLSEPVSQLPEIANRHHAHLIATSLAEEATSIDSLSTDGENVVLIMGGEAWGLSDTIEQLCSHRVRIPMWLPIDSLNVAVAAGIFLYELTRRHNAIRQTPPRSGNE